VQIDQQWPPSADWEKEGSLTFSWSQKMKFVDRQAAGCQLATKLAHLRDRQPVVLALPRGGVAVASEIARTLDAPLDIVLVRKIGAPSEPELAVGAVSDGARPDIFIDRDLARVLDIPESYLREETGRQLDEIERRRVIYCAGQPSAEIAGRTAIVVDDGIATGATMRVALRAVRRRHPAMSDAEVTDLLARAAKPTREAPSLRGAPQTPCRVPTR
jgi:putative phosphoribosyl transferase